MQDRQESEIRRSWPVILACFWTAVFAWGFGFYGQSVYLAELHAARGWPASVISAATTAMYLGGALAMPWVHTAMLCVGPRRVLVGGVLLLGLGAALFATAQQPWQLFVASLPMALGWAASSGTAIAAASAFWFHRQRPLALSLALNGASASGFLVAPVLVQLAGTIGLSTAVPGAVAAAWCLLLPLLLTCVRRPLGVMPRGGGAPVPAKADRRLVLPDRATALRSHRFWSVAGPFALGIAAQVGLIVHAVAFLTPSLGPSGTSVAVALIGVMAMVGRLAAGAVIHRLPVRRFSAASLLVQAAGLGLMLAAPDRPVALIAGSVLFGVSVGNVITLPAIIIQHEFADTCFGTLVGLSGAIGQFTLALGPVLFGLLHDISGGYGAVLMVCIGLQLAAALLVAIPTPAA